MGSFRLSQFGVIALLVCLSHNGIAQDKTKAPNKHILTWSAFADNTLALHRKLTGNGRVVKKSKTGGYAEMPDFYVENTYYDPKTKKLISRVQWERAHPEQLHTIEVYLYDEQGRVVRDYAAAYLPNYHTVPTQTLISLHHYQGDLHAFRTFDASGYRIVERCTGTHNGKEVNMLLDEDEIADGAAVMQTPAYKACFDGVQEKAGKFLIPQ